MWSTADLLSEKINPLRVIFFKVNMNIYLQIMSFLHIDVTQVFKSLPKVR